jgi:hypothetical protein
VLNSTIAAAVAPRLTVDEAPLDPSRYGAVGDGTTVDRAAINAAVAAMSTGQTMRLRAGKTYIVDGGITHKAGVTIDGTGATIKIKPGTTPTYNVFQPSSAMTVLGLTIDLNKANTTDPGANNGIGIYAFAASGWPGVVTLRGVRVINGYQPGLRVQTTTAATDPLDAALNDSRAHLEGVSVDNCKWGIWLQNAAGVVIDHPLITNTVADGIWDYFSRGNQVIGGHVKAAGGHNIVTQYSHGFEANGVQSTGATMSGIIVGGGSTTLNNARDFRIVGCEVRGNAQHGISVDPTKTGAPTTLQTVYGAITGNIVDDDGISGIYLHNVKYATVTGNVGRGHTGTATAAGLALDAACVAISGNTLVENNYGLKFSGTDAGAGYGFHEVGRNVVRDNVTANYLFDTHGADNTALDLSGAGAPTLAAPNGATYRRTDGGTGTTLYVREAGAWVAK